MILNLPEEKWSASEWRFELNPINQKRKRENLTRLGYTAARSIKLGFLVFALPVLLSGCLFNRVVEVKQQACAFDENFELQFSDQPKIIMKQPVLLHKDILWMAGVDATSTEETADGLLLTFEAEEDVAEPNPANNVRVDFAFNKYDDEYRLHEIRLDPKVSQFFNETYLDPETIAEAADNACNTGLGLGMTGMEMDLSAKEIAMLPTRSEVLRIAGPPQAISADGAGWEYRYRMKGQPGDDPIAQFTIWFDEGEEKPRRMESRYSRYEARADLETMKVSMNIDL